jgi:ribulose-5-phosphate 4-epimerase/fuculose-1-phosphate aldolase
MSEVAVRDQICLYGRSLFERGLTPGSSGNISVRLEDGGFLMTPTDASLGSLDPARLSRLDADGRLISGDKPTKEGPLHQALYDTRDASGAVVHLHSTHSVAVSMLPDIDPHSVLPPLTAYYVMRVGDTALVPYHRPGDPAIADAIRGFAGRYSSVLLANHGPVVASANLMAAVNAIEELEETAKLYLLLRGLKPRLLSPAQVEDLRRAFGTISPAASCPAGPHDHPHA